MPPILRLRQAAASALVAGAAAGSIACGLAAREPQPQATRQATWAVARRDFVRSVRLSGTVEAVQSTTISTPRLSGQNTNSLVITSLVRAGAIVRKGDLVVEFDRQEQLKTALDRRAELSDLEQQLRKKDAEERAAGARDDSEFKQAETGLARAELEMVKNEMLPKIQVEKNRQTLEEAQARLKQLKATYELKRSAAAADLKIVQIRRDRAANAMRQAEENANKMSIRSPIDGLAVLRSIWKSSNMAEVQEGEEVRAGMPIVDIVNPSAMRVRVKVNQADITGLRTGQVVVIGLDAYPDLTFKGRIMQISPLAVASSLSPKVRTFVALVDVQGTHPNLMPDLTASLDVELERVAGALVIPRDAIRRDGDRAYVRVEEGGRTGEQPVTLGSVSAHEAVVTSGLWEGVVVARHIAEERR